MPTTGTPSHGCTAHRSASSLLSSLNWGDLGKARGALPPVGVPTTGTYSCGACHILLGPCSRVGPRVAPVSPHHGRVDGADGGGHTDSVLSTSIPPHDHLICPTRPVRRAGRVTSAPTIRHPSLGAPGGTYCAQSFRTAGLRCAKGACGFCVAAPLAGGGSSSSPTLGWGGAVHQDTGGSEFSRFSPHPVPP